MPETTALILGSGFADLADGEPRAAAITDYGTASSALHEIELGGRRVRCLFRHGNDHSIPPHRINYRANIAALRDAGYTDIVAVNTVGVVTDLRQAGEIALPDQILDYTWGREHTFHTGGDSGVLHVEFTDPLVSPLRPAVLAAAAAAGIDCYDGGVYAATQGPRLETAAEVDRLERDGADYVGMTAMPEAALAAELSMSYLCLALVVNKAAGRGDRPIHADVEASSVTARAGAWCVLERFFASAERAT